MEHLAAFETQAIQGPKEQPEGTNALAVISVSHACESLKRNSSEERLMRVTKGTDSCRWGMITCLFRRFMRGYRVGISDSRESRSRRRIASPRMTYEVFRLLPEIERV